MLRMRAVVHTHHAVAAKWHLDTAAAPTFACQRVTVCRQAMTHAHHSRIQQCRSLRSFCVAGESALDQSSRRTESAEMRRLQH